MWEELLKPGLSGVPAVIEWAGGFAGIVGATWWGRVQMMKGKAEKSDTATLELAGAVIDKVKADELVGAMNRLTAAANRLTSALKASAAPVEELKDAVAANTATALSLGAEVEDLRPEIRELTRELVRSGK